MVVALFPDWTAAVAASWGQRSTHQSHHSPPHLQHRHAQHHQVFSTRHHSAACRPFRMPSAVPSTPSCPAVSACSLVLLSSPCTESLCRGDVLGLQLSSSSWWCLRAAVIVTIVVMSYSCSHHHHGDVLGLQSSSSSWWCLRVAVIVIMVMS